MHACRKREGISTCLTPELNIILFFSPDLELLRDLREDCQDVWGQDGLSLSAMEFHTASTRNTNEMVSAKNSQSQCYILYICFFLHGIVHAASMGRLIKIKEIPGRQAWAGLVCLQDAYQRGSCLNTYFF
ncbi:hypothetical protein GDO86_005118 [Hymenochirus boettgeri]|uniref:Uncharacterized protein n=1 Tax=Hymenochirus boettgeri TaxID=247094 RepID=A0A8T2J3E6_9PIPI|nr:hypothetical protein GDO86_005118 [Hymenochirus boettgeri]